MNERMNRESTRSDQRFDRGTGTVEIRYASRDLSLALDVSLSFIYVLRFMSARALIKLNPSSSSKPFSLSFSLLH